MCVCVCMYVSCIGALLRDHKGHLCMYVRMPTIKYHVYMCVYACIYRTQTTHPFLLQNLGKLASWLVAAYFWVDEWFVWNIDSCGDVTSSVCVCMYVCIYICVCVCVCVRMYIWLCVSIYVSPISESMRDVYGPLITLGRWPALCVHVCMCVCVYVCIYGCAYLSTCCLFLSGWVTCRDRW
jgi:hypothetical protein